MTSYVNTEPILAILAKKLNDMKYNHKTVISESESKQSYLQAFHVIIRHLLNNYHRCGDVLQSTRQFNWCNILMFFTVRFFRSWGQTPQFPLFCLLWSPSRKSLTPTVLEPAIYPYYSKSYKAQSDEHVKTINLFKYSEGYWLVIDW